VERALGGVYRWGIEPEVAVGILPRTQFEVGLPLVYLDSARRRRGGTVAGRRASWTCRGWHNPHAVDAHPAIGVAAGMLLPAGPLGPGHADGTVQGAATKTVQRRPRCT
jgi:hypothetical protein